MKGLAVITLFVLVAAVWARPEELYTDQFDNIDVDEILNSERLLNNYFNCLKTGKKCTPDGLQLKEILPDALKTKCSKCTDTQKRQSKKVVNYLIKNKYNLFTELETIYDPDHKYRSDYGEELKKEGINLPPL